LLANNDNVEVPDPPVPVNAPVGVLIVFVPVVVLWNVKLLPGKAAGEGKVTVYGAVPDICTKAPLSGVTMVVVPVIVLLARLVL
jgi:hypothetical protein